MKRLSLLLVGCGNMGRALLERWVDWPSHEFDITIIERDEAAAASLNTFNDVTVCSDFDKIPDNYLPDVVILAVKPQTLEAVMPICSELFGQRTLYLSIAAGKTISFYQRHLGPQAHVVRAMPNTPAMVGQGITALVASGATHESEKEYAIELMRAVGEVVWLEDEKKMDVVTAISGSGPAYVFYFMEAMMRIAVDAGLKPETAKALVMHTVHGSSELAFMHRGEISELREQVTSPGGTTEAALSRMMRSGGMLDILQDGVHAAIERAEELGSD